MYRRRCGSESVDETASFSRSSYASTDNHVHSRLTSVSPLGRDGDVAACRQPSALLPCLAEP